MEWIYIADACVILLGAMAITWVFRTTHRLNKFHRSLLDAKSVKYDEHSKLLTIERENDLPIAFRGNCTVWHWLPSCQRCSTDLECVLADLWERARYERELNAHVSN